MCRRRFRCSGIKSAPDCGPWRENPQSSEVGKQRGRGQAQARTLVSSNQSSLPQLLQQYQMMADGQGHGGVLPVGNPKLFGSLLHDPGQRSIVGMTHERTKVVDDVMVEPAREPAYKRVFRRIIGGGREDVIHAVFKLATIRGKVGAVDGVRRLEYERHA